MPRASTPDDAGDPTESVDPATSSVGDDLEDLNRRIGDEAAEATTAEARNAAGDRPDTGPAAG